MGKHLKFILIVLGIFVFVIFIVDKLVINPATTARIDYLRFYAKVDSGDVSKVTVSGHEVGGDMRDGTKFTTTLPSDDADIYKAMRTHRVDVDVVPANSSPIISWILKVVPFILMALLLIFIVHLERRRSPAIWGQSRANESPRSSRRTIWR